MHPLGGIRVIECGVAVAGPLAARYLAHLGAEVIKVDSRGNSGFAAAPRWAPKDIGPAGLDLGAGSTLNGQKLSVGLDLKHPDGYAALLKLVEATDVFVTNLSVPAIESLKITFAALRPRRPDLIYISMTGFGDGPGPYRQYRSWGPNLSALSGLDHLTGDPDRPPVMHPNPYPDHVSAFHAVVAVVKALMDRQASGQGQEIRMAQLETVVNILGPHVLAAQEPGNAPMRSGNRHAGAAPHGLFPCRGQDRWVAIEVLDDRQWTALLTIEDLPAGLRSARFATAVGRLAAVDEVEALLTSWTAPQTDREVALRLQQAGVPANPVQSAWDHVSDPQLEARAFWRIVGHDRFGTDISSRLPMLLSGTPTRCTDSSPSFGHDTEDILKRLAGLGDGEIERLVEQRVAETEAPLPPHIDPSTLERPSRRWAWPLLRVFDQSNESVGEDEPAVAPGMATSLMNCRVLDLSDDLSVYGTRLLAAMGADVVRVEPPEGADLRGHPPVAGGASQFHRFMDAGKKSVVIGKLSTAEGKRQFEHLVESADVIYESLLPGQLARRGVGWERIHALNPRAVLVSVTPFGQSGPYRDWGAGELGIWARSGSLPLTGYPDRRPTMPGGGLGRSFVGTTGAIATLAALHARNVTGKGQWVDVSAHEVLAFTASGMLLQIDDMAERIRNGTRALGTGPYGYFVCRDRLICLLALMPPHWESLSAWILEKTGNHAALDPRFRGSGASRYQYIDEVDALVNALAGLYDAQDFCLEAQARGVPAMPVNSMADLLADPHLAVADFWRTGDDPGVRWPGPPVRMSGTRTATGAPSLGEHTADLLGTLAD